MPGMQRMKKWRRNAQVSFLLQNARALAADYVRRAVEEGDCVVDATMGNGHDTVFLARLVGETGCVTAFDVQEEAVRRTRELLRSEGLLSRCELLRAGHECMAQHARPGLAAVMFNLGWLPGGDKRVTTCTQTTLSALLQALELIAPGGIVTVCVYPGHEEGERERAALLQAVSALDVRRFNALHHRFVNATQGAPELYLIQKNPLPQPAEGKRAKI